MPWIATIILIIAALGSIIYLFKVKTKKIRHLLQIYLKYLSSGSLHELLGQFLLF